MLCALSMFTANKGGAQDDRLSTQSGAHLFSAAGAVQPSFTPCTQVRGSQK